MNSLAPSVARQPGFAVDGSTSRELAEHRFFVKSRGLEKLQDSMTVSKEIPGNPKPGLVIDMSYRDGIRPVPSQIFDSSSKGQTTIIRPFPFCSFMERWPSVQWRFHGSLLQLNRSPYLIASGSHVNALDFLMEL
jgi:hypothetical protein